MSVTVMAIAAGGAAGSVMRYYAGVVAAVLFGSAYPFGTLFVNVTGSFVIGILAELLAWKWPEAQALKGLLITGFLGGFTTFSAFSLDVFKLADKQQYAHAMLYVAASVLLSLIAVFAAVFIMRGVAGLWQN